MPIRKGKSKKTIRANIKELIRSKPSTARKKGIKTLAKRKGVSEKKAQAIQATAIAYSKARMSGRKYKGKKK